MCYNKSVQESAVYDIELILNCVDLDVSLLCPTIGSHSQFFVIGG